MKLLYLDTAQLVANLVQELGKVVVHHFLQNAAHQAKLSSTWVETELASALAMQCRRGGVSPADRKEAWQPFQALRDERRRRVRCRLLRVGSG